jgi:hydroxymethylbilane synthase
LKRASYKGLLVYKDAEIIESWKLNELVFSPPLGDGGTIATSSIRRKAQWLNRFPNHAIENLRGNVNTRLKKVAESNWQGAIFAAAGLERIGLRPEKSIELDWMLPAPAQGAIMVVCREADEFCLDACASMHDAATAMCTKTERDFLRTLLGGCSTPISALGEIKDGTLHFKGNIFSLDGKQKVEVEMSVAVDDAEHVGVAAANDLLRKGGSEIANSIRNAAK